MRSCISWCALLVGCLAGTLPARGQALLADDAWAERESLVGYWAGAYVRLDSTLRVRVRIERNASGAYQAYESYPDWIFYGWLGPEPIEVSDDGVVGFDGLYGPVRLRYDDVYREMIGQSGDTTPPTVLHLKRVPPPVRDTPVAEREISFGPEGRLSGTLVLPEGEGARACVLFLSGRGCQTRGSRLRIARYLAGFGVAGFAFDERGARSGDGSAIGGLDCAETTFDSVVEDALAAYRAIVGAGGVDADRVGVLGVSAGAWTAQGLAERVSEDPSLPRVGFAVTWIGPATSIERQQRDAGDAIAARLGLSESRRDLVRRHVDLQMDGGLSDDTLYDELKAIERIARDEGWLDSMFALSDFPSSPDAIDRLWMRRFAFDPARALAVMSEAPYLAVFGEEDDVVPLEASRGALEDAFEGSPRLRVVTVPGIGHSTEHGDIIRRLEGRGAGSVYYKFDRVEPRYLEATIGFLREIGAADR